MSDGRRVLKPYFVVILLMLMTLTCIQVSADDAGLVAEAGGPYESSECQSILLDASGSLGAEAYRWSIAGAWSNWSAFPYLEYMWRDEFDGTVTLEVRAGNLTASDTAAVMVLNVPPVILSCVGPAEAVSVGQNVEVRVTFSDMDPREGISSLDSFSAVFSWGDGSSSSLSLDAGSGLAVGSHVYRAAGTYAVAIVLSDDDGGSASADVSVVVSAPASPFAGIYQYLEALGLPKGVVTSLEAKLAGIQAALADGKYLAAAGKLAAFINELRAQLGKKIPASAGDDLTRLAKGLLGRP